MLSHLLVATLAGHVMDVATGHHDLGSADDWRVAGLRAQELASIGALPAGVELESNAVVTPDRILNAAMLRSRYLVGDLGEWIDAVAAALIESTTLTGVEIAALKP